VRPRGLVSQPLPAGPLRLSRRRVLALAALAPAAGAGLAACTPGSGSDGPDPLIALARQARDDVDLITATVTAAPALGDRLTPARTARADHAAALEAEVARVAGGTPASAAPATSAPANPATPATTKAVTDALRASAEAAAKLVPTMEAARVGLVAGVVACCATYAEVLS